MSQPLENLSKTLLILIQLGPHTTNSYPNQKPCNKSHQKYIKRDTKRAGRAYHTPPLLLDDQQQLFPLFHYFFFISPPSINISSKAFPKADYHLDFYAVTPPPLLSSLHHRIILEIIFPCLDFRSRNESRLDRRSRPRVPLLRLVFLVSMVRLDALYFY